MGNNNMCSRGCKNSDKNDSASPIASCFFSIPPKQLALLSSILGILLVDDLDLDQQNSLGNFIVNVGSSILTAAAQGSLIESNKNDQQNKEMIKNQICELQKQLN